MTNRRIAVLTDGVSPGFFFPLWHRYYSANFGARNLYVMTYAGMSKGFKDFELGGIWEVPFRFEEDQRCKTISSITNSLLTFSDVVLRVENDEFLIADPFKHDSLTSYVENLKAPYVTARGMNIIQSDDEPELDMHQPILVNQRRWAQPVGPLNKTCIVRSRTEWAAGFHWCDHFPHFDDLFLMHFKHADLTIQLEFPAWMIQQVRGTPLEQYYTVDLDRVMTHRRVSFSYPKAHGDYALYRKEFNAEFLNTIQFFPDRNIYHGNHIYESVLVELPERFAGLL